MSPTFTSLGAWARAPEPMKGSAAAVETSVRRVSEPALRSILSSLCRHWWRSMTISHAEIGLPDSVVGAQSRVRPFQHHPPGLEHIALVGGFKGLRDALLHQQDRELGVLADLDQLFKDEVSDRGREPHRGLVQHQQAR